MPKASNKSKFSADELKALNSELAALRSGTPETEAASTTETAAEETTQEESAKPAATGKATATEGSATAATTSEDVELSGIPADLQSKVKAIISKKERDLQAGWTKKYQELGEDRKVVEPFLEKVKTTGKPAQDLVKASDQYYMLLDKLQNDPENTIEYLKNKFQKVNLEQMTDSERREYDRKSALADIEAAKEKLRSELQPHLDELKKVETSRKAEVEMRQWRASRQDLTDEQLADIHQVISDLAPVFAGFSQEGGGVKELAALIDKLGPLVSLKQAVKATAVKKPGTPIQSRTEVPRPSTREAPTPRAPKGDRRALAEELAKDLGFNSLEDMDAAHSAVDES